MILYTKTGCFFCKKVLDKARELGIPLEERNISDPKNLEELLEKGGKRQTPFLVDEEKRVSMYESDEIIKHLVSHI